MYHFGVKYQLVGVMLLVNVLAFPVYGQEAAPEKKPVMAAGNKAGVPNAPAQDEPLSSGSFLSSYVAHSSGDNDTAVAYLEKVLRDDPDNYDIMGQLLVMKLMTGEVVDALALAERLKTVDNHELIVDLLLSIEQARLGQFKEATAKLQNVGNSAGDSLWLPLIHAWLDAGQGLLQQPVEAIDFVKDTSKIPFFLYYHLALINDFAGFSDAAQRQYELAVADIGRAPYRAVQMLANFYERKGHPEKRAQLLREYTQARPEALKLLSQYPDADDSLTDVKPSERLVGSVQDGLSELLFTMASVLYSADQGYDTLLYLQMAVYMRPDFPAAWLMLGNSLEATGYNARAVYAYGRIDPKSPLYHKALVRKAFLLDKQGNPAQALQMLDKLAEEQPNSVEPYIAKGDLLRSKSQFAAAVDAYTQAVNRLPQDDTNYWPLYFTRGACLERTGQIDKAEADLQKALALMPEQPEVLNYLGYMWLVHGKNVSDAAAMITKAYAQEPEQPHILDSMGWMLYKTGHLKPAVLLLERAVALMPNDASINEHLGDAYWHSDRRTEARYQWKRAASFAGDPKIADNIRSKMSRGLTAYKFTFVPFDEESILSASAEAPAEDAVDTQ